MSDNSQDLPLDVHLEFLFYESLSNHTPLLSTYIYIYIEEKKTCLVSMHRILND